MHSSGSHSSCKIPMECLKVDGEQIEKNKNALHKGPKNKREYSFSIDSTNLSKTKVIKGKGH